MAGKGFVSTSDRLLRILENTIEKKEQGGLSEAVQSSIVLKA